MKKALVSTFYTLQGLGHLIFVFYSSVRGFNGGAMTGFEILIRLYFRN